MDTTFSKLFVNDHISPTVAEVYGLTLSTPSKRLTEHVCSNKSIFVISPLLSCSSSNTRLTS